MKKKELFTILSILFFTLTCFGQNYNPKANSEAIVKADNVRFTILTPRVIRMEWSEDGNFVDNASLIFVNRQLPVPEYSTKKTDTLLLIKTEFLEIRYKTETGKLSENNLSVKYFETGKEIFEWHPGLENKGNLLGTARTLDGVNGATKIKRDGKHELELGQGIISTDGWVLIDDSGKPIFDNSEWQWVMPRDRKEHQDWYFFGYGKNYKDALYDFTQVAGKIPIPPKFTFGIWWSRYWAYSDLEYRELVNEYKIHNVPLDVLVVDMDWHITEKPEWYKDGKKPRDQANQWAGWTGLTWEKAYFPDHKKFLKWTDEQNIKTCLNLHPASGIQPHEEAYPEFAKAMGIDPETKKYIPFDIVNKKYAQNFFDLILHPMENAGVDFWWLDWQQWSTTTIDGVKPIFYLNYVLFSDMQRQGKRPLIFHRWGGLGNHRYQIGFSGDTYITWESLNYQPYFTSTASNVCFGYWSHDIGGHYGGTLEEKKDPELYTRWIQWGAFSPVFRTHCTKDPEIERRMWAYPIDYFYAMRDAVKLRYSLFPYIYTAAKKAHETGVSLISPMYYDFPEEENAYKFPGQYMFGNALLIAPITGKIGKDSLYVEKEIWLPKGKWIEYCTGTIIEGNKIIKRPYLLSEIPIFVKQGAIIPMQSDMNKIAETETNPLILTIFPGQSGQTKIYDDAGDNENYLKGEFTFTKVNFTKEDNKLNIHILPIDGEYENMPAKKAYEVRLPLTFPPKSVKINGNEVTYNELIKSNSWSYNGNDLSTIIKTNEIAVTQKINIEITFPDEDIAQLSGKVGLFNRMMFVNKKIQLMRSEWKYPLTNYMLHDIAAIAQTGYRISLNSELKNVKAELSNLEKEFQLFYEALEKRSVESNKLKPVFDFVKVMKE
ncbi:MAG: glycoside hydrolase family 31 protein [Bacteroidales bacterium]|nr:glycoside hydrolase family 31 protein [Bacteroidales bacterium]